MSPQQISAISFVTQRDGYGLDDGDVVMTFDGGLTWDDVATARQTGLSSQASGLLFTSQLHGFVWTSVDQGPSLSTTFDGGAHWQLLTTPIDVQTVLADGSSVWAVTATPTGAKNTRPQLWESSDGGQSWGPSLAPLPSTDPYLLSAARSGATTGYVITDAPSGTGYRDTLFETPDSGGSWITRPVHAPGCSFENVFLQASSPSDLWLACGAVPGAGEQIKLVYHSTDSGQTWQLQASDTPGPPMVGNLSLTGYITGFEVVSGDLAYIAEGRGALLESTDGGRSWRTAASNYDSGDLGVVLAPLVSPTATVALVSGQSWETTDGTDWSPTT